MSRDPRLPAEERKNPNIERPDYYGDDETRRELEPKKYGTASELRPAADETSEEEYKAGGLPKTSRYSVQKKKSPEPSVSRPRQTKEQSDRPAQSNYGF